MTFSGSGAFSGVSSLGFSTGLSAGLGSNFRTGSTLGAAAFAVSLMPLTPESVSSSFLVMSSTALAFIFLMPVSSPFFEPASRSSPMDPLMSTGAIFF